MNISLPIVAKFSKTIGLKQFKVYICRVAYLQYLCGILKNVLHSEIIACFTKINSQELNNLPERGNVFVSRQEDTCNRVVIPDGTSDEF